MTKVLIIYYSAYGHILKMAKTVKKELDNLEDAEIKMLRVPEFETAKKNMSGQEAYDNAQKLQKEIPEAEVEDLVWADGIIWGIPTRFGNMPAQLKQFIDQAGGLWQEGKLEDVFTGIMTSTNTMHGGQETTIISSIIPMIHLGMVYVGLPYGDNPELFVTEAKGGSPYGASTIAGADGSRTPDENELKMAVRLGKRVYKFANSYKENG